MSVKQIMPIQPLKNGLLAYVKENKKNNKSKLEKSFFSILQNKIEESEEFEEEEPVVSKKDFHYDYSYSIKRYPANGAYPFCHIDCLV